MSIQELAQSITRNPAASLLVVAVVVAAALFAVSYIWSRPSQYSRSRAIVGWWRDVLTPKRLLGTLARPDTWYPESAPIGRTLRTVLAYAHTAMILDLSTHPCRTERQVRSAWRWWMWLCRIPPVEIHEYRVLVLHYDASRETLRWMFRPGRIGEQGAQALPWDQCMQIGGILVEIGLEEGAICVYHVHSNRTGDVRSAARTSHAIAGIIGDARMCSHFCASGKVVLPGTEEVAISRLSLNALCNIIARARSMSRI